MKILEYRCGANARWGGGHSHPADDRMRIGTGRTRRHFTSAPAPGRIAVVAGRGSASTGYVSRILDPIVLPPADSPNEKAVQMMGPVGGTAG